MKRLLRLVVISLLSVPVFGADLSKELDRYQTSYDSAKFRKNIRKMELLKEKIQFITSYYDKIKYKWVAKNSSNSYNKLAKELHDSLKNLASQSVLKNNERQFLDFDSSKYIKEYTTKNPSKINTVFTKEFYDKVVADAKKKYIPINKGDKVTVSTRRSSYTGKFGGFFGNRIKVGHRWVPIIDLSKDLLDRMKPAMVKKNRIKYVHKYYTQARKEAAFNYNRKVKSYVNKFKREYYTQRSQKMIDVWTVQYRADIRRTMSELDTGLCKEFREYKLKKNKNRSFSRYDGNRM